MPKGGLQQLFSLEGRIAFVSGAGGHLGSAIARSLAEAGAQVFLNGRKAGPLEELRDELRRTGWLAEAAPFDVDDDAAVDTFFVQLNDRAGQLNVLVNNAYAGKTGTIDDFDASHFRSSYEIAVVAAARLMHRARPLLVASAKRRSSASVINIASMYGTVSPDPAVYGSSGLNNPPFYGAAKAGLLQLTRYAACHLAADNIRVNAISPGPFPPSTVGDAHPEVVQELRRKVPLRRLGEPADLVGAVAYLASDASAFVTGINLPVDGGWTAW